MYCRNCGNKLDDNAYVCVKCGVLVNAKSNVIPTRTARKKDKEDSNATGILSIIFSSLAVLYGFNALTTNIDDIGMYIKYGIDWYIYLI